MEVAGFIIAIFALVIGILALVLSMRALYIIGVNAGLDKQFDPKSNTVPTPAEVKIDTKKEFKKPIRVEGDKIIYNDDPLIYVIEDFITDASTLLLPLILNWKELKQSVVKMVFIMKIELAVIVGYHIAILQLQKQLVKELQT